MYVSFGLCFQHLEDLSLCYFLLICDNPWVEIKSLLTFGPEEYKKHYVTRRVFNNAIGKVTFGNGSI